MINSKVIYVDFRNRSKKNSVICKNQGILIRLYRNFRKLFHFSYSKKPSGEVFNFKKTM